MNPGQGSNPNNAKIQSFLEALRASRGSAPKTPGQESGPNPFGELQVKKETENRRIELFHQARQQEWNRVYSSKEKEIAGKIETIQQQLKEYAAQVNRLDKNIQNAVNTNIVSYGDYQIGFLEHLSQAIRLWQVHANDANSWLEIYNGRANKLGIYWQMAKRGGNNFTQSNERTAATSVG